MNNNVLQDSSLLVRHPFVTKYDAKAAGENARPIEIGAVYYRRSNPPEYDWERDYQTAREDGHTMFRHWFTWNAIHVAPDTFDFSAYDKHLDLAAKYGIKTIIAEHIYEAPDWLYHRYPHARRELANGSTHSSMMGDSNATGITRMCLDNAEVAAEAKKFLSALARHYRDNPGLYGYDIWNECSLYNAKEMCYCPATQAAFRTWLRNKYDNNLERLRNAWRRYSIASWDDIELPRLIQPYPDTIDMLHFRADNALEWMKIRHDTIRVADNKHYVVAHGNAKTFCDLPACGDDYTVVPFCDIYGYTFWYGNGCHTMLGSDMIRIAASGKEFWRAEAIGNSDWQRRGGFTKPLLEKEAMADPANIRLDALYSLMAGARGYINPRWRALQDGGLFDGYGWYNLDGTRSMRSEEVKKFAAWANGDNPVLRQMWKAQPLRGEIGLVILDDAQYACYAMYDSTDYYSRSYQGAYEAFLDAGIQADPIRIQHINDYRVLYLPFPVSLGDDVLAALKTWVAQGGTLIAEGCFAYFSRELHAFEHQPSRDADELIGAKQNTVSFGPDMWENLSFSTIAGRASGGVFKQSYLPTTGKAVAWYDDGTIAAVESTFGKGNVRVIGTMTGYGYKRTHDPEALRFFASCLPFAGRAQRIQSLYNSGLVARLWASEDAAFLWCVNQRPFAQHARLAIDPSCVRVTRAECLRGTDAVLANGLLCFDVAGRDGCVYRLT